MLREVFSAEQLDYSKLVLPGDTEPVVPVIAVDEANLARDGLSAIRMVGFANRAAVEKTIEVSQATFYSRQRKELWTKGESSGNVLSVVGMYTDCDNDTLLLSIVPEGPTCHTGTNSCFEATEPVTEPKE